MKTKILLVIASTLLITACSKSGGAYSGGGGNGGGGTLNCAGVPKSYMNDVDPIIQSTCNAAGCHATGSSNGPGPLTNYSQVFNARSAIRTAIANGTMPKNMTLSTSQKNSILCWIDSGAPQN